MAISEPLKRFPGYKLLKSGLLAAVKSFKYLLFIHVRSLFLLSKPKITLGYENQGKPDGIGAQVQRILALRSLSNNLRLGYFHTGIKSVAVHPLDPFQSPVELDLFLDQLNKLFHIANTDQGQDSPLHIVRIKELTFRVLLKYALLSFLGRRAFLLLCIEPYPVSEFDKNKFKDIIDFLPNYPSRPNGKETIAIHYRRGVGGFAVQAGEQISREIESNYFRNLLTEIVKTLNKDQILVSVFTDSPSKDLAYNPPEDQQYLWENSPRFEFGIMSVQGMRIEEQFSDFDFPVSAIYGGNPLDVLIQMSFSDHLVMSRSSFSYVAAILNRTGVIYFPKSFWHGAKLGWKVIDESRYV